MYVHGMVSENILINVIDIYTIRHYIKLITDLINGILIETKFGSSVSSHFYYVPTTVNSAVRLHHAR